MNYSRAVFMVFRSILVFVLLCSHTHLNREDAADERLKNGTDQARGDKCSRRGLEEDEQKIIGKVRIVVEGGSWELNRAHFGGRGAGFLGR
jgi:hypothetical protein